MNDLERKILLNKAKDFFYENIVQNHIINTKKLTLKSFNTNPFLNKYLAQFVFGNSSSKSIAKALLYPRILGTSINTTFGTQIQQFCSEALESYGSLIPGIDIEFVDAIDNRKKYCQLKAGPQTINKDDVKTIKDHFKNIKNLSKTNKVKVAFDDCVVGVFYGNNESLSACYKAINKEYPVYVGQEFWHRLTGDKDFYFDLIDAFTQVADKIDASKIVNKTINKLAKEIEKQKS